MRAPRLVQIIALAAAMLPAAAPRARAAAPGPSPAASAAALPTAGDCPQLLELYRACHRLGQQSDSALTCQEAAQDLLLRSETRTGGRRSLAARALSELVCSTGCEDAASGQPAATVQEFTEAFCDTTTKPQGGRP